MLSLAFLKLLEEAHHVKGSNLLLTHEARPFRQNNPRSAELGYPINQFFLLLLKPAQNIVEHFFVFQADGKKNRFHWPGMGLVNGGRFMEFGPVEKAAKCLVVFLLKPFQNYFRLLRSSS